PQGRERAGREGHRAAAGAVRGRPGEGRGADDRPQPPRGDPPRARPRHGCARPQPAVRGADGDLRGARAGQEAPSPLEVPRHRHLGALDRGDGAPDPPRRRGAGGRGESAGLTVTTRAPKPKIPLWRWGLWWVVLAVGDFIFYVLLTPVWIGLRGLAWVAEFRR